MKENPESQTPNISKKPPFKFPPYRRRRPLQSQTFSTFIRILSECHFQFHKPEQSATIQGDQLVENNDSSMQGDQLVKNNDSWPKDGLAREKSLVNENTEVVSSQDLGFTGDHMDIDRLDSVDNVKSNGDNVNGMESVVEGSQNSKNDFAAFASLIDNDDQFSLPDFDMEEFGLGEQLGEKAPCVDGVDVSGLIDSLLETDVIAGSSTPVDITYKNSLSVERDETETQLKGRESDTPVSASVMVSSSFQKTVEGIEDGEILEVSGVLEKSSDLLHEDVSLEKKSVIKGPLSGDIIQKEGFSALQRGLEKDNESFGLAINGANITSTALDVDMGNDDRNLVENRTTLVYYGDIVEDDSAVRKDSRLDFERNRQRCGPKEANSPASYPKKLSLSGGSTGENTIENQCSASTEKVANLNNKKRKGGPITQEGKAKKKKKERIKRAEKNRKLGVKRLKLQPVSKPKTVINCRHFLKGRCHEGEKCIFSHDSIPLTKSKPCRHFARQSCMKGDDCPYDHQLSKYPCNNYLTQGSCIRGSNCMFSHEVPVKEGSSTASDICKSDLQSVSAKENSNLKKQMNPNATGNQSFSAKLCSSGISSRKNEKQNGERTTLKPAGQAPKGISFLSHGKVSVGNVSKHGQSALSPKADNGAKVDQQTINGASDVVESLNKNTQRRPVVPPRGVNFLSFGKAPFESSTTKNSCFSSIGNVDTGKSPLSDPGKSEQAGSSSKTDVGGKVDSQTGQGASSIVRNMNETTNRTPAMTPRELGFLSVGNCLDSSFNKKQDGSNLNEINAVQLTVKNHESVNDKLWSPNPVLPHVSSSLLPCDRSLGKLINVHSKSSLSSSRESVLSNSQSSVQKALRSTLAFAAKFKSETKKGQSYGAPAVSSDSSKEASSSSQNKSMKASTILDFLYSANSKTSSK